MGESPQEDHGKRTGADRILQKREAEIQEGAQISELHDGRTTRKGLFDNGRKVWSEIRVLPAGRVR